MKPKKPDPKLLMWVTARKRHHLAHAHVQMARELGMNPKRDSRASHWRRAR